MCDTVILSAGLIPENELAMQAGIGLDQRTNGLIVDQYLQTSLAGVLACGNAKAVMDLADYVFQEGALAGENAARFIQNREMTPVKENGSNPMARGLPPAGSLTCILCPNGCQLIAKDGSITGNRCPRGVEFGRQECEQPRRSPTATLLTSDGALLPVRTDKPIPKGLVMDVMDFCKEQVVASGCRMGDILFTDVLHTGANIIACSSDCK